MSEASKMNTDCLKSSEAATPRARNRKCSRQMDLWLFCYTNFVSSSLLPIILLARSQVMALCNLRRVNQKWRKNQADHEDLTGKLKAVYTQRRFQMESIGNQWKTLYFTALETQITSVKKSPTDKPVWKWHPWTDFCHILEKKTKKEAQNPWARGTGQQTGYTRYLEWADIWRTLKM